MPAKLSRRPVITNGLYGQVSQLLTKSTNIALCMVNQNNETLFELLSLLHLCVCMGCTVKMEIQTEIMHIPGSPPAVSEQTRVRNM